MRNDYSWLADKKRDAMAQKLQRRGMPNLLQRTVAERYGSSYTGLGDDGRVDRSAPAGLDTTTNPPHIYHEGETRVKMPEGAVYLNADIAPVADPGAMSRWSEEQGRLKTMEGQLPGFASGGGTVSGFGGNAPAAKTPINTLAGLRRGIVSGVGGNAIGQPQQQSQQQQNSQGAAQSSSQGGGVSNSAMPGSAGNSRLKNAADTLKSNGAGAAIAGNAPGNAVKSTTGIADAIGSAVKNGNTWLNKGLLNNTAPQLPEQPPADVNTPPTEQEATTDPELQPAEPQTPTPPDYLSTETPAASDPSTAGLGFTRGMEGQQRIGDMRQEAASQQAYLQHQQAMKGTDANAAWAQSAMAQAQAEEGINNYAANYAIAQDEQNRNWAMSILNDPNATPEEVVAAAHLMNSTYFAGTGIDFSGRIDAAKLNQYNTGVNQITADYTQFDGDFDAWWNSSDAGKTLAKNMGISEADVWRIWNNANISAVDREWNAYVATGALEGYSPEELAMIKRAYTSGLISGDLVRTETYKVYDSGGNEIGAYTSRAEAQAKTPEGGRAELTGVIFSTKADEDLEGETNTYQKGVNTPTDAMGQTVLEKASAVDADGGDAGAEYRKSAEYRDWVMDYAAAMKSNSFKPTDMVNMPDAVKKDLCNQIISTEAVPSQNKPSTSATGEFDKFKDREGKLVIYDGAVVLLNKKNGYRGFASGGFRVWFEYEVVDIMTGETKTISEGKFAASPNLYNVKQI